MQDWLKERTKEKSTLRGAILIASLIGVVLSPEQVEAIFGAAIAIIALWETFRKESKS